jgi:co-chaperonin GroES (HSP10)
MNIDTVNCFIVVRPLEKDKTLFKELYVPTAEQIVLEDNWQYGEVIKVPIDRGRPLNVRKEDKILYNKEDACLVKCNGEEVAFMELSNILHLFKTDTQSILRRIEGDEIAVRELSNNDENLLEYPYPMNVYSDVKKIETGEIIAIGDKFALDVIPFKIGTKIIYRFCHYIDEELNGEKFKIIKIHNMIGIIND